MGEDLGDKLRSGTLPYPRVGVLSMFLLIYLVKLVRDLTRPGPPNGGDCKGSPLISGKSRLVKYYSIWPDLFFFGMPWDGL